MNISHNPSSASIDWNDIARKTYDWVERVGWHNKSVLEALALITSEIGEAANECMSGRPTGFFGEELADIVLRTADLAAEHGVDLTAAVAKANISWQGNTLLEHFAYLLVDMAKWVNTARNLPLDDDFGETMGRVMRRVAEMADENGVDLQAEVLRKMEINELRGVRGRHI